MAASPHLLHTPACKVVDVNEGRKPKGQMSDSLFRILATLLRNTFPENSDFYLPYTLWEDFIFVIILVLLNLAACNTWFAADYFSPGGLTSGYLFSQSQS